MVCNPAVDCASCSMTAQESAMEFAHRSDTSRKVAVLMAEYTVGSTRPVNCRMGAEHAIAPSTLPGYFIRNHDASMPPYDLHGDVDERPAQAWQQRSSTARYETTRMRCSTAGTKITATRQPVIQRVVRSEKVTMS